MKTLASIIEDARGNVVGAELTDGTQITLAEPVPRAQLAALAPALAAAYGVTLTDGFTPPEPAPAPAP
jgi:hypothetical protein